VATPSGRTPALCRTPAVCKSAKVPLFIQKIGPEQPQRKRGAAHFCDESALVSREHVSRKACARTPGAADDSVVDRQSPPPVRQGTSQMDG